MSLPAELDRPLAPPVRGGPTDPSHDAELRRGILRTAVARPTALAMIGLFLAIIYGVPIVQAVLEKRRDEESMLLDLFKRRPTRQNLKRYEEDLEKACYAKDHVQPRIQLALTRLGAGNKEAVVGRQGWLYYGPGVLSLAAPGFLDADAQTVRARAAVDAGEEPVFPDPRPAVLALHRALAARGIRLVLFPIPEKSALQPAQLHGRGTGDVVATNRDHARFLFELRAAGVLVFEAAPEHLRPGEPPRFLVQDTHWTPSWMEEVAGDLAGYVRAHAALPPRRAPDWRVVAQKVARVGDIVDMLKLPEGQTLFAPQEVEVHQVQAPDGSPWEPSPTADVLLLGDSFTNVYSLESMGWGTAAGLGPHLARALGRPVDVMAQNGGGAHATRKLLSEALGAGEDRLAGKRVVIWELAVRELVVGNWKPYRYEVKR
jgi:alginate O-acetyltransferase complex protein AlgJ